MAPNFMTEANPIFLSASSAPSGLALSNTNVDRMVSSLLPLATPNQKYSLFYKP